MVIIAILKIIHCGSRVVVDDDAIYCCWCVGFAVAVTVTVAANQAYYYW